MAAQRWLPLLVLLTACSATPPLSSPSTFRRDHACHALEKHALDLYASERADVDLIDDTESSRVAYRELFEAELRNRGTLQRLVTWCLNKLSEPAFDCSIHAKTTEDFEACQPR